MIILKRNKYIAVGLITLMVGGCATQPRTGNHQATSQTENENPCNVGSSAVVGALAGGILGAIIAGKKGVLEGAAVGGAVGAIGCLAIKSNSRQVKTAAQVDQEYVQTRGVLPREPQLLSYTPRMASSVQRGQPFKVTSVVELVNGSSQPVNEIREELLVFDPQGEKIKNGAKPLAINSGGRFENSFEVTLPEGVSQGSYSLKTNLYVNGKLTATRDLRTQLVWNAELGTMVATN